MKPFKPPTLVRRTPSNSSQTIPSSLPAEAEPPAKKRRISDDSVDDKLAAISAAANILKKPRPVKTFQNPVREPLHVVKNPSEASQSPPTSNNGYEAYFNVLWFDNSLLSK